MSMVQTEYTQVLQKVKMWPAELRQNLAGEIIESLEADSAAPSEWNETRNTRRCALIDKEIDGTLTPTERVELELLQKQAVAYRDRVAPPCPGVYDLRPGHATADGRESRRDGPNGQSRKESTFVPASVRSSPSVAYR